MQRLSVFDIFKIGVGPSSSHTMGPWRAAQRFLNELPTAFRSSTERIVVELFGSLAKTGRGHGTDIAVQLGLCGEDPEVIDVAAIQRCIQDIEQSRRIELPGGHIVAFNPATDIVFHMDRSLGFHPNAMRFTARLDDGRSHAAVFYSVGGGFITTEQKAQPTANDWLPFPIDTAEELLAYCKEQSCRIADIVMQNELHWRDETHVRQQLSSIRDVMIDSIYRGCHGVGVLPGGLNVNRRAPYLSRDLLGETSPLPFDDWTEAIGRQPRDFRTILDWVSCFALAVNEENAAFGRVVTAPTNGAAGVIPAVLFYCRCFCDPPEGFHVDFLLTAGEIGCIFKKNATISAALGGCQAEIGVSSAMAAAALTQCLGGSPYQVAEAAEIAMEHHLGMTCDPVGGLVQIPCIERNAMGAIKAITAAQMALRRDPIEARVSLDAVIRTMWETAGDMNAKYKETSEAGLATQIAVNLSEC